MINFPSDRPDAGQQSPSEGGRHVAGSQEAADALIARNMKRAARRRKMQSTPTMRWVRPREPQTRVRTVSISPALILIAIVVIVAVLVIALTSVQP